MDDVEYLNQSAITDSAAETAQQIAGTKERFKRSDHFPIESKEPLRAILTEFFPHRYDSLRKEIQIAGEWRSQSDKNGNKTNWTTSRYPLSDANILKAFIGIAPCFYGCRFGDQSRFAVIDIDAGSEYHNVDSVNEIRNTLRVAGLKRTTVYQSSDSTGWHMYIFFSSRIGSVKLHDTLKLLLQNNGFNIEKGTLEIFPNLGKSSGFGLRLPLQHGFAWLDQKSLKVSDYSQDLKPWERCKRFIADTEICNPSHSFLQARKMSMINKGQSKPQSSNKQLKVLGKRSNISLPECGVRSQYNKINVKLLNKADETEMLPSSWNQASAIEQGSKDFTDLAITFVGSYSDLGTDAQNDLVRTIFNGTRPNGLDTARWLEGRDLWLSGLTHFGQRAHALYCINHYCFYGDPSRDFKALGRDSAPPRIEVVKLWLSENHNGFSKQINDGAPDAYDQIERMNNGSTKISEKHAEDQSMQCAYQGSGWQGANDLRSKTALEKIIAAASVLQSVPTAYELAKLTGCAIKTVKKHRQVWEPLVGSFDKGDGQL